MVVGSVSQPLTAADGSTYLIYLPPKWTAAGSHPVLLFLHGVGGINNGDGCRKPGLTTQFPLLDPKYAAKVQHIVIVPVAKQRNWRHHFDSSMALVDMALSQLGGDPSRVAIAGQSMGGHGAYLYASELAPGRFCAVVAMCGYVDENLPLDKGGVPAAVTESLKSTPIWVFHSDVDDEVPPPGRPADDPAAVVAAFKAAGNTAVKLTRYPKDRKGANYIPGHAAFELGFAEEEIWPWLLAQSAPQPPDPAVVAGGALFGVVLFCAFVGGRGLARLLSTVALLLATLAYLGLMQSDGGIIDFCSSFAFFDVSAAQCRDLGADIAKSGAAGSGWLALAISKGRGESCFALGMGVGALYALLFKAKGTSDVAVVHLMHSAWGVSVALANSQNAGLLAPLGVPAEANIGVAEQAKLVPFAILTAVQGFVYLCAFLLSRRHVPKAKQKTS